MPSPLHDEAATEAAYLVQLGHDVVSFGDPIGCTSFILAPHAGQSRIGGAAARALTFSTTTGFVRAWLKLLRGSMLCFPNSSPIFRILKRPIQKRKGIE
jgi:hypothetical protein